MNDGSTRARVFFFVMLLLAAGIGFVAGGAVDSMREKPSEQLNEELKTTVQDLKKKNEGLRTDLEKKTRQLRRQEEETQELVKSLEQKLDESQVDEKEGVVTVSIPDRIVFDEASAELSRANRKVLRKVSRTLKEHPNREIRVQGHADTLPMHPDSEFDSNWELSAHRAVKVLKYLVYGQGIDRTRIGAVAFGQFRPAVTDGSEENRAKNRRVEIVLYPDSIVP